MMDPMVPQQQRHQAFQFLEEFKVLFILEKILSLNNLISICVISYFPWSKVIFIWQKMHLTTQPPSNTNLS